MKKRSQAGPDMLFRCYCCGHLRMGQREPFWGAQGTEDDKCSERALGNRVRRLVAVFVLRHSRPFSLVWSEPHCGPEVTFQQELPANGNARVWRKRASWEGMGSTCHDASAPAESGGEQGRQPCFPCAFSCHTYLWGKVMVRLAKPFTKHHHPLVILFPVPLLLSNSWMSTKGWIS